MQENGSLEVLKGSNGWSELERSWRSSIHSHSNSRRRPHIVGSLLRKVDYSHYELVRTLTIPRDIYEDIALIHSSPNSIHSNQHNG